MTYLTFHLCALRKSYHLSQEQWVVRQGVPQVTLMVKNLPDNAKDGRDTGLIPGSGRSPGGGHGNPLQFLAWEISWTEELGRLQSMGSQRVRHD